MHEAYTNKTTFQTHEDHYEFLLTSFGLYNVLATFLATMNEIFQPYIQRLVIVFFDDILIYSKTLDEHLLQLRTFFYYLLTVATGVTMGRQNILLKYRGVATIVY